VTLELDTQPRSVDVPTDLAAALDAVGARERFDRLSYSVRKEHVRQVEDEDARDPRATGREGRREGPRLTS
jgi:hypothetical protein